MDIRTYLQLEVALTRKLQKAWHEASDQTYASIADLCRRREYDQARALVPQLSMAAVGDANREYIKYALLGLAVFGAGMTNHDAPAFLQQGTHEAVLDQATSNIVQYLTHGATADVQQRALQLIADAQAGSAVKREVSPELVMARIYAPFAEGLTPYANPEHFAGITSLCRVAIEGEMESFELDLPSPYQPADKNDKWKLTSALQKAIRRGDAPEARRMASAAVKLDSFYTWRRLDTIALEDIGMGDLETVAMVLATSGDRALRARVGEERLAAYLSESLALAVKDRSLDDVYCIAEYGGKADYAAIHQKVHEASNSDLAEIALSDGPVVARSLAFQTMHARAAKGKDYSRWSQVVQRMELPPLVEYVALMASYKGQSLASTFPLCASLALQSTTSSIQTTPIEASPLVGDVAACALDGFTRAGKSSLAYLSKSSDAVRGFFEQNQATNKVEAMGYALFTREGGLLDRQIVWDHTVSLAEQVDEQEFRTVGLNLEQGRALEAILEADVTLLQHARRRVTEREQEERAAKLPQLPLFSQNGTQDEKQSEAVPALKADERRYVKPFVSFDGQGDDQLQLIASLNSNRLASWGFLAEAEVRDVREYKLAVILDGRTSAYCRDVASQHRVYQVEDAKRKIDEVLSAQDPNDLRTLQPWPKQDPKSIDDLRTLDAEELTRRGLLIPPFHPRCRTLLVFLGFEMKTGQPATASAQLVPPQQATQATFAELGQQVTPDEVDHWNSYVGVSPVQMLSKLLGISPQDLMDGKWKALVSFLKNGNIGAEVTGIADGAKVQVGTTLDPFTGRFYLDQADFTAGDPGAESKFLGKLLDAMTDVGASVGATSIVVQVSTEAIAYIKLGFTPSPVEWQHVRQDALASISSGELRPFYSALDDDEKLLLTHILESNDETSAHLLVMLPWVFEGQTIGEAILGEASGPFSLDLTNQTAVDTAKEYLAQA